MQFILAVIQSEDAEAALAQLKLLNLPSVVSIATSGGFLRQSNTTLSMLVNENQVNEVLASLRSTCQRRTTYIPTHLEIAQQTSAVPVEVEIGGGTVFIGEVERFEEA